MVKIECCVLLVYWNLLVNGLYWAKAIFLADGCSSSLKITCLHVHKSIQPKFVTFCNSLPYYYEGSLDPFSAVCGAYSLYSRLPSTPEGCLLHLELHLLHNRNFFILFCFEKHVQEQISVCLYIQFLMVLIATTKNKDHWILRKFSQVYQHCEFAGREM
jgi:hypothetical protein